MRTGAEPRLEPATLAGCLLWQEKEMIPGEETLSFAARCRYA